MNQFQSDESSGFNDGFGNGINNDLNSGENNSDQVAEAKDVGFVGRLFGMLHDPRGSFTIINNMWEWLLVTLLFITIGFGVMQLQKPYLLPDLKRSAMESLNKARDQIGNEKYQELKQQIETDLGKNFELTPKNIVIGLAVSVAFTAFMGLILWVLGNFVFGGEAKFWQVVSIVAFAGIITVIHDLARGGLMTLNDTSYVYLGLGLLKPEADGSFVFYLLRQMEFMTMWKIAAMSAALSGLYRISAAKFAYVLVPLWLLAISAVAAMNLLLGGTIVY